MLSSGSANSTRVLSPTGLRAASPYNPRASLSTARFRVQPQPTFRPSRRSSPGARTIPHSPEISLGSQECPPIGVAQQRARPALGATRDAVGPAGVQSAAMDVRASDTERDAAIERLRESAAQGRLSLDELTERIEAASNAVMRSELVRVVSDLPTTAAAQAPSVRAVGDVKRTGAWIVPAENHFRTWWGNITLDLRHPKASRSNSEPARKSAGSVASQNRRHSARRASCSPAGRSSATSRSVTDGGCETGSLTQSDAAPSRLGCSPPAAPTPRGCCRPPVSERRALTTPGLRSLRLGSACNRNLCSGRHAGQAPARGRSRTLRNYVRSDAPPSGSKSLIRLVSSESSISWPFSAALAASRRATTCADPPPGTSSMPASAANSSS